LQHQKGSWHGSNSCQGLQLRTYCQLSERREYQHARTTHMRCVRKVVW
jgi:hypothetical protein